MLNRTMCLSMILLSSSLLFTIPTNTKIPFIANNIKEVKVNEMVQVDKFGIIQTDFEIQYEKDKTEREKVDAEKLKQKELEEQNKVEDNNKEWQTFVLTYYGLLHSECGKTDGITASGKRISRGMVASPKALKFGTKILIDGDEYIVEDRGSSKYIKVNNDGSIRLDVYVERYEGESDKEYYNRIQSKGVKRIEGYIIK